MTEARVDTTNLAQPGTVSVATAARLLGISRSYGYEMARSGALPTLVLGQRRRVTHATLRKLLGEQA